MNETVSAVAEEKRIEKTEVFYQEFIKKVVDTINQKRGFIEKNLFEMAAFLKTQVDYGIRVFKKKREEIYEDISKLLPPHIKLKPKTIEVYYQVQRFLEKLPSREKPRRLGFSTVGDIIQSKIPKEKKIILLKEADDGAWTNETVRQKIKAIQYDQREEKSKDYPNWLQTFNIWEFSECDPRFGKDGYPGRIPGQIVANLLWFLTEKEDLVVDPFGGSGTTLDVCNAMHRKCLTYDISPSREDIKKWDITEGYPEEAKDVQLLFLDPPYFQQKKGEYSADATNLANLEIEEFHTQLLKIMKNSLEILKEGGYLAVIIGASQKEEDEFIDHSKWLLANFWNLAEPINRIIVPYTTQQYSGFDINRAKEQKKLLNFYRDLIIVRKKKEKPET